MNSMHTDCRSEEGITVGLIDAIISICRVLSNRDLKQTESIREAMLDLTSDLDFANLALTGYFIREEKKNDNK